LLFACVAAPPAPPPPPLCRCTYQGRGACAPNAAPYFRFLFLLFLSVFAAVLRATHSDRLASVQRLSSKPSVYPPSRGIAEHRTMPDTELNDDDLVDYEEDEAVDEKPSEEIKK